MTRLTQLKLMQTALGSKMIGCELLRFSRYSNIATFMEENTEVKDKGGFVSCCSVYLCPFLVFNILFFLQFFFLIFSIFLVIDFKCECIIIVFIRACYSHFFSCWSACVLARDLQYERPYYQVKISSFPMLIRIKYIRN